MTSQILRRLIGCVVVLVVLLGASFALAQDSRVLTAGQVVSGTIDTEHVAQTFVYNGLAKETITVNVTTSEPIRLAYLITDALGETMAQAATAAEPLQVTLASAGVYYVTVVSAESLQQAVDFQLVLAVSTDQVSAFVLPGELVTQTGIQISLSWAFTANLDLEVRDPVGGSLRFATPQIASGGQFGVNANSVCSTATATSPTETATWSAGAVPTGGFEILVYYQPLTDCPTTESVPFAINVTVDGLALPAFTGTLLPQQVYLASFMIGNDGKVTVGGSGLRVDPPSIDGINLSDATPIAAGALLTGALTNASPAQIYTFTAQANDVATIALTANSGSLDTLLLILDPNGQLLATNDDLGQGVTDSQISDLALIVPGQYTVVATRYGQALGGTQGDFEIGLTLQSASADQTNTVLSSLPDLPVGSLVFSLQWDTNAELQLLVRDPSGATVYNTVPTIASGGELVVAGNQGCVTSGSKPLSYIRWPEGRLPAGSYEVEVQYRNNCNDLSPVTFTLNGIANDQRVVLSRTQQLLLGERYVTSVEVGADGSVTAGEGGVVGTTKRPSADSIDYAAELEGARIIANGETVNGVIRQNQKFALFVFNGTAGQVVTVGMNSVSGTLDPVLFLIGPNGDQVAENDDAARDTRNALVNQFILREDGQYIIIATHFGGRFGVTAGDYTLTMRVG